MAIDLNTGSIQVPTLTSPQRGVSLTSPAYISEYNDTNPSEPVVFPKEQRHLLIVEPNKMIILTGYNLDDSTQVKFRKVLRSSGVPIQGSNGCCPTVSIAHSIRLNSAEVPCWVINKCNPIFILKTPGSYELDVQGNSIDVVVTAMTFDVQDVNEITGCECNK